MKPLQPCDPEVQDPRGYEGRGFDSSSLGPGPLSEERYADLFTGYLRAKKYRFSFFFTTKSGVVIFSVGSGGVGGAPDPLEAFSFATIQTKSLW